jgi:hypothetical protein
MMTSRKREMAVHSSSRWQLTVNPAVPANPSVPFRDKEGLDRSFLLKEGRSWQYRPMLPTSGRLSSALT